jgi:hypothetical protein
MNAVVESSKTTIVYADGARKVFSPRNKVFTDSTITDEGIRVTAYFNQLNEDGEGIFQTVLIPSDEKGLEFIRTLAARGAEDVIKSAVASASKFHDTLDEDGEVEEKGTFSIVSQKIEDLSSFSLTTRTSGAGSSAALSKWELAYARFKGLDVNNPEDLAAIKEVYNSTPKEERKAPARGHELYKAYMEVDLELDRERSRLRQAEKEKLLAESE